MASNRNSMPGSTRRGFALLGTLAIVILPMMSLAPVGQALPFADELRRWEAGNAGPQLTKTFLLLASDEVYDKYLFHIKTGDGVPVAAASVQVLDLNGAVMCSGPMTYTFGTLSVLVVCPNLRVQHHYQVDWIADRPGTQLFLSGDDFPF